MTSSRRLASGLALVAALAAGAAAGCGRVGEQSSVERIHPDELERLRDGPGAPADPTTTSTTAPPAESLPVDAIVATLYFIEGDMIVEREIELPPETRLRGLLAALERDQPAVGEGVRSELPTGLIRGTYRHSLPDGVTVDLDGELFAATDARDHQLLFGQIVLTITDMPEPLPQITEVRFTRDGEPIAVPLRDGTLSQRGDWVTRADYELLLRTLGESEP